MRRRERATVEGTKATTMVCDYSPPFFILLLFRSFTELIYFLYKKSRDTRTSLSLSSSSSSLFFFMVGLFFFKKKIGSFSVKTTFRCPNSLKNMFFADEGTTTRGRAREAVKGYFFFVKRNDD